MRPPSAYPGRMSLRSVPDARRPVPASWWVPLIAVVVLATTTVAILPSGGTLRGTWIAVGVSLAGCILVWCGSGQDRYGPDRTRG